MPQLVPTFIFATLFLGSLTFAMEQEQKESNDVVENKIMQGKLAKPTDLKAQPSFISTMFRNKKDVGINFKLNQSKVWGLLLALKKKLPVYGVPRDLIHPIAYCCILKEKIDEKGKKLSSDRILSYEERLNFACEWAMQFEDENNKKLFLKPFFLTVPECDPFEFAETMGYENLTPVMIELIKEHRSQYRFTKKDFSCIADKTIEKKPSLKSIDVKSLLHRGLDPNSSFRIDPRYYESPLLDQIIQWSNDFSINNIIELVAFGMDLAQENSGGETIFFTIARKQSFTLDFIQFLTSYIDINKQNKKGETPMLAALRADKLDTVLNFLKAGADPMIADNNGVSPYALMESKTDVKIFNYMQQKNEERDVHEE